MKGHQHPGAAAARIDVPDQPDPAPEIEFVRWWSQMQADLSETLGGVMLRSARPVSLTVLPSIISQSPGRLVGWSFHETSGTPFLVRFRNGIDSNQPPIAFASQGAGGVAGAVDSRWLPGGISFTEGLYVDLAVGAGLSTTVEGVVYIGAAD